MGILEDIQRIAEADRGTHTALEYGFEAVEAPSPWPQMRPSDVARRIVRLPKFLPFCFSPDPDWKARR